MTVTFPIIKSQEKLKSKVTLIRKKTIRTTQNKSFEDKIRFFFSMCS